MSAVGRASRGDNRPLALTFGFGRRACTRATASAVSGPPIQEDITIQDSVHGEFMAIVVIQSDNADTPAAPFTVGTTGPIAVTATKITQSQGAAVAIQVTTVSREARSCSYVFCRMLQTA